MLSDESYTYDEFGNRYGTVNPENYAYDKNGAVLSADGISFEYDSQGNRTKRTDASGVTHYFYNESDRLIRVEKPVGTVVAQYDYDPQGYRNWKDVGGARTYFYHTEEGLSAEFDSAGNTIRSYVYEPESYWGTAPLAMKSGANYHYFHTDHLGTPQKLTAKGGATTWAANYSGFGAATVNTSTVTNPVRFPGQYYDSETGLHQNFMRDYDPEVGAYLEQDPYGILTGPNRYGYVYGDPVGLSDPTGEIAFTATAIGVGFGVAFFVGDQALSGFPAIKCSQYLWDSCLYADQAQACLSTGGSLVLSLIGGGSVNFGTKIISGIAGKIVKRFGGFGRLGSVFRGLTGKVLKDRGVKNLLSPQQFRNLARFNKKKPSNSTDTIIRDLPNGVKVFQADSPARNIPGSFARFEKQVDASGKTIQFTKTTFGPDGKIIHVKDKITGHTFVPR